MAAGLKAKEKAALVEMLSEGVFVTKACAAVHISPTTYYAWRRADEQFDAAVEAALESRIAKVEDALWAKAVAGNVTACIFWLCNRAPERWQHVQRIQVEQGLAQPLVVEYLNDWRPRPEDDR